MAIVSTELLSAIWATALALPALFRADSPGRAPASVSTASKTTAVGQATATASAAAATPSGTPNPYLDGSVQAGATKAAVCFSCHGPDGNRQNPAWPRLAGQNAGAAVGPCGIAAAAVCERRPLQRTECQRPAASLCSISPNTRTPEEMRDVASYVQGLR